MKKIYLLLIAFIMYLISGILVYNYIIFTLNEQLIINPLGRVFILVISCLFMYIGAFIISRNITKYKSFPFKLNIVISFILYIFLLSTLTLFDDYFHRGNSFTIINWNRQMLNKYLKNSFNIKPFATIYLYINNYFKGYVSTRVFMYNIFGNVVALMPFAFFLPLIFKKQNNFWIFILTMFIVVILIEGLQFLTLSGSCDIDDVILNVTGACLLFKLLSIKSINSFIRNLFLLENNQINYFNLIINVLIIAMVLILISILVSKYIML